MIRRARSAGWTGRRPTAARAAKQQAIEGGWHGGKPPFGYRAEGCNLYVIPEQAELVREAAQRILAGETVYRILTDWNQRGARFRMEFVISGFVGVLAYHGDTSTPFDPLPAMQAVWPMVAEHLIPILLEQTHTGFRH